MDVPEYFKSLTLELKALKNRVRQFIENRHWLTDGEWKEGVLRNILRRNLPDSVGVGRGFIITDTGSSGQIDILIYDKSKPVLFRDGDLVFITPDAVEGVIEVKSSIDTSIFREACERLIKISELILRHSPRNRTYNKFFSIFSYESRVRKDSKYLDILSELSDKPNRLVHFCCLSSSKFIRFWFNNPQTPGQKTKYEYWHSYKLKDMAYGYFLHNVVEAICPQSVKKNESLWYPINGKEFDKTGEAKYFWNKENP
jgi:hypothetical protein